MSLLKSIGWNALGSIASKGSGFLTGIFVARSLGPEGLGLFSLIYGLVPIVQSIGNVGLQVTGTREISVAIGRGDPPAIIGQLAGSLIQLSIFLSLIASVIIFSFGYFFYHYPALLMASGAISSIAPVAAMGIIGFANALNRYDAIAKYNLLILLLVPLGALIGATCGTSGALLGTGIASIAATIIFIRMTINYSRKTGYLIQWNFNPGIIYRTLCQAGPMTIITIFYLPVEWWGIYQLSMQTNGSNELGLFSIAKQISSLVLIIPGLLTGPLLANLSRLIGENNISAALNCLWKNLLISLLSIIIVGCTIYLSPHIFGKVYNVNLDNNLDLLNYSILYSALWAIDINFGSLIFASNATYWALISLLLRSSIILFIPLTGNFTGSDLAFNYIIANSSLLLIHLVFIMKFRMTQ